MADNDPIDGGGDYPGESNASNGLALKDFTLRIVAVGKSKGMKYAFGAAKVLVVDSSGVVVGELTGVVSAKITASVNDFTRAELVIGGVGVEAEIHGALVNVSGPTGNFKDGTAVLGPNGIPFTIFSKDAES